MRRPGPGSTLGRPQEDKKNGDHRDGRSLEGRQRAGLGCRDERAHGGGEEAAGLVGGQMLESEDDPRRRVIVGTWQTRDDWEKWHEDPEFAETREELEGLVMEPEQHEWHEVVLDVRRATARPVAPKRESRSGARRQAS
ncbi:MAG TPA: antibiotic biosynthesis monooxygenase [Verrucomicrobiae bacterium]|nr:antibiotic biosynthesis monooxygenase [Verrucomicrobiae bacterium]